MHRLARFAQGLQIRVLTLDSPGSEEFDRGQQLDVRRVVVRSSRRRTVASLNVAALEEVWRFRPAAILSGHVVVAPASLAVGAAFGLPVVQYVYAKELGARPALSSFAVRRADATIAISRYTRALAARAGAPADRTHLIPPGVDLPQVDVAHRLDRLRRGDVPPVIVTVARMQDRYKGHDTLARAMPLVLARVPGARWDVIGDGPLRPHIERLVASHGVAESVRFLGQVSDRERDALLEEARVFAMPSRLPAAGRAGEGFGIVYLEASGRGLPVVAGNVAGARDAVVDGQTGLLVDPDDPVAVAEAIGTLLKEPARATAYAAAGMAHARRYTWEAMGARVADVMRQVVRQR